jgi:hypothetical protein
MRMRINARMIRNQLLSRAHYLVIFIASLITLIWFRGNTIISIWDTTLPLNNQSLGVFLYAWHPDVSTGISDPALQMIPYQAIFAFGRDVGLSTGLIERLLFVCLMALSGITMYNFSMPRLKSRLAALASSFVYMFNLYAMLYIWREFLLSVLTYALLPLLLTLFHDILFQKPIRASSLVGFLIVSLFVTIQGPPLVAILILGLYAGGSLFLRGTRLQVSRRLALLVGLWTIANLWWLMPFVFSASSVVARYGSSGFLNDLEFNSQWSSVFNVMRLEGSSVIYGQTGAPSTSSWTTLYETSPNILFFVSLLFPVLASASLLKAKVTRSHLYAAILWIVSVLIVAGTQPPLGSIYRSIFNSSPYLLIARDPYLQLGGGVVFAYALLTGYFFKSLRGLKLRRISGRLGVAILSALLLISLVVVHPWPMWTGNAIPTAGTLNVPTYYQDAANWLDSQPVDFRVLSLPMQDNTLQSYDLPGSTYYGQDILRLLTGRSIISEFSGVESQETLQRSVYDMFYDNSTDFPDMLETLNVRFIVFHGDINEAFHTQFSANKTLAILNNMQGLQFVRAFGPLEFFEDNASSPMVYLSTHQVAATVNQPLGSIPLDISNWTMRQGGSYTPSASDSVISFQSAGTYSYAYIQSPLNFTVNTQGYSYLLIQYWSEGPASILANADGNVNCCFMAAVNPPSGTYLGNAYYSSSPYTIAYDLGAMGSSIKSIGIFVSNGENTLYNGTVRLHLISVSLAGAIGFPSDFRYLFANNLFSPGSDVLVNESPSDLPPTSISQPAPIIANEVNPTLYDVKIQSEGPFFIVLGQQFDQHWSLVINGIEIPLHLMVNGFANGWYVSMSGTLSGEITYTPQQLAIVGTIGPVLVVAFLILIWITSRSREESVLRRRLGILLRI